MKSQELIASVIDSQQAEIEKKPEGLLRELFDEIPVVENFASIITGIRRCGKSTLMLQILKKHEDPLLFLNFEDIRLSGFETSDFNRLNAEIERRKVKSLFFDEIQIANQWEIFINQKMNEGYRVFITGSNASLLSKELGTHLTGRHLSAELFPFSFFEFLTFTQSENNINSFNEYMETGGMPEYLKNRFGNILRQLIDDILYRDIAVRHNIRNVDALRELTVFLISNIGKPISARQLTGLFGISAAATIIDYCGWLQDAYVVDFIPVFDYSIKTQIRNPKKVYVVDLGIFHQIKTIFTDDYGRQLENLVYLHLRRKYQQIFYFNKNGECDFIVKKNGQPIQCIQVCYQLTDMNMNRELTGLKVALDYFKLKEGIIVTHNQTDLFETHGTIIKLSPAWKYFMSD